MLLTRGTPLGAMLKPYAEAQNPSQKTQANAKVGGRSTGGDKKTAT